MYGISVWMILTIVLMAALLFQAVTEKMRVEMIVNETCLRPKTINDKAIQDFLSNYSLDEASK